MPRINITLHSLTYNPRTGETIDPEAEQGAYRRHAFSIDEPLPKNFDPCKIYIYAPIGFRDLVLDLPLGEHTITVGNDVPPPYRQYYAIFVNDRFIADGEVNAENFLTATFTHTQATPYTTWRVARKGEPLGDVLGCPCAVSITPLALSPWDRPGNFRDKLNPNESCYVLIVDMLSKETTGGYRSTPVTAQLIDTKMYSAAPFPFALSPSATCVEDRRLMCQGPGSLGDINIVSTWHYHIPIYVKNLTEPKTISILTGHIEDGTAIIDDTTSLTLYPDPNAPRFPGDFGKIAIDETEIPAQLIVPNDFCVKEGEYAIVRFDVIALRGTPLPWFVVQEYPLSLFNNYFALQAGEKLIEIYLFFKITSQMLSQGYVTLQVGHFEPPDDRVSFTPMKRVIDDAKQIPLPAGPPQASINALRYTAPPQASINALRYTAPPQASINALRYTVPQVSASINALRYTAPQVAASISRLRYVAPQLYASLKGKVTGWILGPLSGANVNLNGRTSITDASGNYSIQNIPLGSYTLTATHWIPIYTPYTTTLNLTEAKEYIHDITLQPDIFKLGLIAGAAIAFIASIYWTVS